MNNNNIENKTVSFFTLDFYEIIVQLIIVQQQVWSERYIAPKITFLELFNTYLMERGITSL